MKALFKIFLNRQTKAKKTVNFYLKRRKKQDGKNTDCAKDPKSWHYIALVLLKNSLSRDISCDSIFVTNTELTGEFALLWIWTSAEFYVI